jgi:hypothetical protein
MKSSLTLFNLVSLVGLTSVFGFSPRPALTQRQHTRAFTTEPLQIGGILQGFFGKKDAPITETVYFDVAIDCQPAGRVEMGLYGSTTPKTVENFKQLCIGSKGFGFKDSIFHRIIPGFMM